MIFCWPTGVVNFFLLLKLSHWPLDCCFCCSSPSLRGPCPRKRSVCCFCVVEAIEGRVGNAAASWAPLVALCPATTRHLCMALITTYLTLSVISWTAAPYSHTYSYTPRHHWSALTVRKIWEGKINLVNTLSAEKIVTEILEVEEQSIQIIC